MKNDIFDKLLDGNTFKQAKAKIYNFDRCYADLKSRTDDSVLGLEHLANACRNIKKTHDFNSSINNLTLSKQELDKIAVLLSDFIEEFNPLYEFVIAQYTAAVLVQENSNQLTGNTIHSRVSYNAGMTTSDIAGVYSTEKLSNGWTR